MIALGLLGSAACCSWSVLAAQTGSSSGPAKPQPGPGLAAQSEAELARGQYDEAVRHASECARASALAGSVKEQIGCLTVVGRARVYQGKYAEAASVLEQAAALARTHSLPESEAAAWNDLGSAKYYIGDYTDAHACFTEALAVVERQTGQNWYRRVRQVTIANLAMIEQRLGQYDRALDMYRDLESGAEAMRPAERARLLSNIGALYRRLGDPYKAIDRYRAAEQLYAAQQDHDGEIGVVTNRGIALAMDLEDYEGAIRAFDQAERLAQGSGNRREVAEAAIYCSEALRRLGRYPEARAKAALGLSLGNEIKASEEVWKARLSLGRIEEAGHRYREALSQYREAIAAIESLRTGIAAVSMRAAFLGDKTEAYDGAIRVLLHTPNLSLEEVFHDMEQGRARTLRDRLNAAPASLPLVQSRLPRRNALAEYWQAGDSAAILWIAPDAVRVFDIGAIPDRAIDDFVMRLKSGSDDWAPAATDLGRRLLDPLPLAGVERLTVVPHRRLQQIPFEALPAGKDGLLVDTLEVSYLPAASMLAPNPARGWLPPWRRMLAAFAFRGSGTATGLFGESLSALPGAAAEVRGVAAELGGRAGLHTESDNLKQYVGSLAQTPVLHFATHGIADPDDPERSRLAFSAAHGQGVEYLFAREIHDLPLGGVRLATLAACDTEAGKPIGGEGVAALSRAFLAAGADATLSTLWRISDRSSAEFMRRFYAGLADGESAGAALRSAKLQLRRSSGALSHPRFWAPYVLNGNAEMRTPRPTRGLAVIASALLLIGSVLALYRRRTKTAKAQTASAPT